MKTGLKWTAAIAVLAGLGVAQWKYDLVAQVLGHKTSAEAKVSTGQGAATGQGGQQAAGAAQGSGQRRGPPAQLVKLAAVTKTDFPLIERGYGTMASPQVVGINARIASQITKINVQDGQMVKADEVLIELDDRAVQATLQKDLATLAKDQAVLANNAIQLQRAQTLAARNAGNLQDVDNAMAQQKAQAQLVESDKALVESDKLQVEFTKIKAPFDGKLGTINAVPGALVAASTNAVAASALMTITQMQPLKVNFRLPEQVLPPLQAALANKADAKVRLFTSGTNEPLDSGALNFVDSAVDAASGTINLGANVGNAKLNLWPGQRVTVELEYGRITGALTVPTVAVQQGQMGSFVWVVDAENKAKAQPVKVARYEGDLASISEGVAEGAQVVIEGQAKLSNGAEVRTGPPAGADGKPAADAKQGGGKTADGKSAEGKKNSGEKQP